MPPEQTDTTGAAVALIVIAILVMLIPAALGFAVRWQWRAEERRARRDYARRERNRRRGIR